MGLEDEFNEALEVLKQVSIDNMHYSVKPEPIPKEIDAYKKIVLMGNKALPLIKKIYDIDKSDKSDFNNTILESVEYEYFPSILKIILGDNFKVPKDKVGFLDKTSQYAKDWLDKNMDKYVR
jgi:hypothetical protein